MKAIEFKVFAEFYSDFNWYLLPTIEVDILTKSIMFAWLCFSITIQKEVSL
jgi:hypothetical protein